MIDYLTACKLGLSALASPPPLPHLTTPELRGRRLYSFVLSLDVCQPQNRSRHAPGWKLGKQKAAIFRALSAQMLIQGERPRGPIEGRPQVICVRFSSTEPDAFSDWAKAAIDALCVPKGRRKHGLGLLRDDRPSDAEVVQIWRPAKAGNGFVYLEVRG